MNINHEKLTLNGIDYVRADLVPAQPFIEDGLRYAIVRSRDQGVMAGFVKSIDGRTVTLVKARQLWKWDSKFVLVDLAEYGVRKAESCRFSCEASQDQLVFYACGITYCTDSAARSIRGVVAQGG